MKDIVKDHDIYKKLLTIFSTRFEIDLESVPEEGFDKHLLGREFGMAPRDLVYIYLDIEKYFGIKIPDEDVAAGELSTVNRIIGVIRRQLHKTGEAAV